MSNSVQKLDYFDNSYRFNVTFDTKTNDFKFDVYSLKNPLHWEKLIPPEEFIRGININNDKEGKIMHIITKAFKEEKYKVKSKGDNLIITLKYNFVVGEGMTL